MSEIVSAPFVPVLTVMVDYGMAPFLWLVDAPDKGGIGGNVCDGSGFDAWCPISEGLWRKFADWAIAFDRTQFYSDDFDSNDWDWLEFHARGIHLTRWLKEEVGEKYRVVYYKPCEDPNYWIDTRREVLADGTLVLLNDLQSTFPDPLHFCIQIISGGQTGVDRAALDFAIEHGIPHGGWAPLGRLAEDGIIPLKYQMQELDRGGYRQRTKCNVLNSDGTLILNVGEFGGGTLATQVFAKRLKKPYLVIQLDQDIYENVVLMVLDWLRENKISTLNVAGPSESKRPGIYDATLSFLLLLDEQSIGYCQ